MAKQKKTNKIGRSTEQASKPSGDGQPPKAEIDGKNDSGPEPEIHDREIPPQ
jgi:hypothetical protein